MAEAVRERKPRSKGKAKGHHSGQKQLSASLELSEKSITKPKDICERLPPVTELPPVTKLLESSGTVLKNSTRTEDGKNVLSSEKHVDEAVKTRALSVASDKASRIEAISTVVVNQKENETIEKQQSCDINHNAVSLANVQTPSAPLITASAPSISCSYKENCSDKELRKLIETKLYQSKVYQSKHSNLYPSLPSMMPESTVENVVPSGPIDKGHLVASTCMKNIYPSLHGEKKKVGEHMDEHITYKEMIQKSNEVRPFPKKQLLNLYTNHELMENELYISSFIQNELTAENHELHELLMRYQKAREDCFLSEECINELQKKYSTDKDNIWESTPDIKTEKSCCLDKKTVVATRPYIRISYNQSIHDEVKDVLEKTYEEIKERYCLHLYVRENTRQQIEYYLYSVSSLPLFKDIAEVAPVTGYMKRECQQSVHHDVQCLKSCISVLFSFQRRLTKDEDFLKETRNWLTSLVALLLRVATLEDHLFLLNHILRCPAHVGSWASCYIQSPTIPSWVNERNDSSLQSSLLGHTITVLATLLLPVRSREAFLQHYKSSVTLATGCDIPPQDSHWVFVDSDNEEDLEAFDIWLRWEETDIVSFLSQVPFANMFRFLLDVEESNGVEKYIPEKYETKSSEMLKLFSVATHLIYIFHEGFVTFQSGKYRRLTKYIARYISDSVKYICDHWDCVKKINKFDSPFMKRLEVEFDEFILRAVSCISSAPRKEAWQFLLLPYRCVSNDMMWKIAWILFNFDDNQENNNNFCVNELILNLQDEKMKGHFQEKIDRLEFMEAFYLLSALVEMVNSRENDEHLFVCTVTRIIFEVAFTALSVREKLSKDGRDMLRSIVEKHPYVVSNILKDLKIKIKDIGKASIYLFKELPLQSWKPTNDDIDIISNWLCSGDFPLNSFTSQLARLIISNINWGRNKEGTELMVDMSMHHKVALSIVEAYKKFINVQDRSYVVWAYEQLAWVASAVKSAVTTATATDEEGFIKWAWEILFMLRLHCLDEVKPPYEEVLKGCVVRDEVPSIHHSCFNDATVNSSACYVSILLTSAGHQADSIATEGCGLLLELIKSKQYVAAVSALPYIMPFFYRNPSGLLKNEKFNKCIQLLLTADIYDMTYLQKAKSMISSDSLGKVLPIMASMIKFQIEQAKNMNSSPDVVKIWLKILFEILISAIKSEKVDTWRGTNQVFYLLDEITRIAFVDPHMRDAVMMEIKNIEKLCVAVQEGSSLLDAIVQLIPRSQRASLLSDFIPPKYSWFSWCAVNVELDGNNIKNIWEQVLKELAVQPSLSVNDALKKVATSLRIKFPVSSLPIYKLRSLIMKTPVMHPLFALFCQQFFIYYFYRVPISQSLSGVGSIGRKFFDNSALKEMRTLFESARDENYKVSVTYEAELSNSDKNKISLEKQEILMNKKEFHEKLVKLFAAFAVWLDEPRLHTPVLTVYDLPSNYLPDRLSCIISLDKEPWYLMVDFEKIQDDLDEQLNAWHCYKKSSDIFSYAEARPARKSPQKILKRLNSYDAAKAPPPIRRIVPPFETVQEHIFRNEDDVKRTIERDLQILQENIDEFMKQMSEIKELDEKYHKCLTELYKDVETKVAYKVHCSRGDEDMPGGCSGAAVIFMTIAEKEKDKVINQEIERNRVAYHMLMTSLCKPLRPSFYSSATHISVCLRTLLYTTENAEKCCNTRKSNDLHQLGISLFHYFMKCFDDKINNFQSTRCLFTEQLHFLFKKFIQGEHQNVQLLKTLAAHQHVRSLLPVIQLFDPMAHRDDNFVELYECVVDLMKKSELPQDVFLTLVRKFDISKWLRSKKAFSKRSLLICVLGRALCSIGQHLNGKRDIYDVYDEHLGILLVYEFPEHYGEILNMLLNGMDTTCLPKEAWARFLLSLGLILPSDLVIDNKEVVEEYSRKQSFFSARQVHETLKQFAVHFTEKGNLYEKYGHYVPSVSNVLIVMSHVFIHTTLFGFSFTENEIADSESPCGALWETVKRTFGPWIHPTEKKPPWSPSNTNLATIMFKSFIMCIDYLEKRITESYHGATILHIIWKYYIDTYSKSFVKEHVRITAQEHLSSLKWNEFCPSLEDVQLMIQLVDEQVPDNVNFVSSIFVRIPWMNINCLSRNRHSASNSEVLPVLTNLIVKLAWEPAVVEAGTLPQILRSVEACQWHLVSEETLEQVVNTFIEKCDPQCIFQENQSALDAVLLKFLRIITCMEHLELLQKHPHTLRHRLLYMKTYVHLLIQCAIKYPAFLKEKKGLFLKAVHIALHQIELSTEYNVPFSNQFKQRVEMIAKFLVVLSDSPLTELRDIVMTGVIGWFDENPSTKLLMPCIQAACRSVMCFQYLVEIVETCISKHFLKSSEITYLLKYVSIPDSQEEEFLAACSKENLHLCQYIYVEQKLLECQGNSRLLDMLINWNEEAIPCEMSEQKLILLWDKILELSLKQIEVAENETVAKETLEKFMKKLVVFGKESKMFLLKAPYKVTVRFRFLARFIASYVSVQIPNGGPLRTVKYAEGHISYSGATSPSSRQKTLSDVRIRPTSFSQDSVRQLQALLKWHEYSNIKDTVEEAVNTVMDANNHLGNVRKLLKYFSDKVYRGSPNKFLHLLNQADSKQG